MVIIIPTTILNDKPGKTILNEKVGYHFCQVILLFELRQKVVPYTKYCMKSRSNYEYFYQKLSLPPENDKRTPG